MAMLIRADARHLPLSDACVQCVVTSPPYWGLRDYGITGQLGLEATPDAFVALPVLQQAARDFIEWTELTGSNIHADKLRAALAQADGPSPKE
jgi:hypothetical protein